MMRYSNLELWQFIQKHPDFYNYVGTENDLRDQSGANPIIINLKKGHWYDKSRGEGGELSSLVENLEFPPEQLSIDKNDRPEPLSISQADTGLPERQKAQLKSVRPQKIGLKIVRASTVKIKPIKWIWPGILAQGKLVFLAGDPGLGKSQVSLFICAIISSGGQWPVSDEICTKGNVLILSAEDGAEDLIVPRLKAVNADLEKIHIIQSVELSDGNEKIFDLTSDVEQLKNEAVRIGNVKIIIIDPISAYLGKIDSHRNTEVRDALNPIIKFADEIGACLLCVTHLNKGGSGNALSRVTGSIGFCRSS